MLAGLSTLKSYDQTMVKSQSVNFAKTMPEAKSVDMFNHTGGNMNQKMTATVSTIRPSKSAGSLTGGNDMRKVWQAVLRDCHRSDPQRTGQIARTAFIAAISHANLDEVQTLSICYALII